MPSPEGQLKKKPDPAIIAPLKENKIAGELPIAADERVPYQTGKSTITDSQPVQVAKAETIAEKPKVFIPNLNSSSTSVKIPSLKDMGKTQEALKEEEDPYLKGDAMESFTTDQFFKSWSDFAAKLKVEGKKNALTIFTSNAPTQTGPNSYEIIVENKVQENIFRDERPDLHNFLRSALKNFSIEVSVRIDEKAVVKRPYTAIEKFQHMAQKNPALVDLKNKFNLDFD